MKSSVLVIDVQAILFDPEPQPYESQVVINKINEITELARIRSDPVIFIQHEQPNSVIEYGSCGWALQTNLVTQTGDHFVRKTTPDSFLNTNLQSVLQELGVDHLIVDIMGVLPVRLFLYGYTVYFSKTCFCARLAILNISIVHVCTGTNLEILLVSMNKNIRSRNNRPWINVKTRTLVFPVWFLRI